MLSQQGIHVWALCVLIGTAGSAQDRQPELVPRPGVLVLRGARVLRGDVLRTADQFVVQMGEKSQVTVPADQVQFRCESMHEAYLKLSGLLPDNATVADRLQLGDWCLRYGLMSDAAQQLIAAMRLQPDSPLVERFESRLRIAAHTPTRVSTPAVSHVRQPVPPAELDRMVQDLPPETVDQFTRVIQPLLLNRCATATCHGPKHAGAFQLMRPVRNQSMTRRLTQRNLHSALQLVDADVPARSALLRRASDRHAGGTELGLDPNDVAHVAELAAWVHRIARGAAPARPAAVSTQSPLLLQPNRHASVAVIPERSDETGDTAASSAAGKSNWLEPGTPAAAPKHVVRGSASPPLQDPFDPDEFNRQFGQPRQSPAGSPRGS